MDHFITTITILLKFFPDRHDELTKNTNDFLFQKETSFYIYIYLISKILYINFTTLRFSIRNCKYFTEKKKKDS